MSDEFPGDHGRDQPIGEFDAAAPLDDATERAVADFLRRVLREDPIPGLSVAVVRTDGEAYTDAFGSRDLAGNRAATANTLYGIGSVTKSFAATAVLQLADSGMLSIDDPIEDHLDVDLGEWSDASHEERESDESREGGENREGHAEPAVEPIRIRHLLAHTSGFPSLGVSEALITRRVRRGEVGLPLGDRDDFHAHVEGAASERAAPPGERWAYCNSGYSLLGELVETTTGVAFSEYVADHVFDPLEMGRATFDDTEFAIDDDAMTQYLIEDGELTAASLPTREVSEAAGGILTSVRELGNYLRCQLAGGTFHGTEVLPEERSAELHEPRAETPAGPYGYGWRTREVCGQELIGHAGSIAVSSAYAGFCETEDVGIALAANTSPSYSLAALGEGVFALLVGEDPEASVPYWRRRRLFERLEGTYASYRGVKRAVVSNNGGTLDFEYRGPMGGSSSALIPEDLGDGPVTELDGVDCYALSDAGDRRPAEFRLDGDDVELLVDRWRLRKVSDAFPQIER